MHQASAGHASYIHVVQIMQEAGFNARLISGQQSRLGTVNAQTIAIWTATPQPGVRFEHNLSVTSPIGNRLDYIFTHWRVRRHAAEMSN